MELEPSTLAGVITACATVISACALLVTAVAAFLKARSLTKKVDCVTEKVDEVHVIVNQQRTNDLAHQERLIAALNRAGVQVPVDPTLTAKPLDETPKPNTHGSP